MAVDDFGLEVLKKAAEEVTPGDKSNYYIKTSIVSGLEELESFVDGLESLATTANTLLTTIRDNADQIEGYTDGLEGLITTTNSLLTSLGSNTDQLEGFLDGVEGLIGTTNSSLSTISSTLTTINGNIDQLEGFTDGIEGLLTTTNSTLSSISGFVDQLEGYTDGIETLLTNISGFVDQLEGYLDGVEGLIGTTNSTLASIDAGIPAALGQTTMANSMPVVLPTDQKPPLYTTKLEFLTNGGSKALNVNGSVTPVSFRVTPTAGLIYYLDSLCFLISDIGTLGFTNFGTLASLTNGLQFNVQSNGNINEVINLKDNIDISMSFNEGRNLEGAKSTGFFDSEDFFLGTINFVSPIHLNNASSDYIEVIVRDNLSTVDNMRCIAKYRLTP